MTTSDLAKALGIKPGDIPQYPGNISIPAQAGTNFSFLGWLKSNWIILTGLAILITLAYINTLNNVFISDDLQYMVNNPKIKTIAFLLDYPFTILKAIINWLTYKAFGLTPPPFHIINIIFHIITVWFFYLIICLMTNRKTAIITAFLWAAHPILTESVTWIGGGGYVMYTSFFFISFAFYLLSNRLKNGYQISVLFFFLTLCTSEKAIPLSLAFFIYEISMGNIRKNWKKILPFAALSGVWTVMIVAGSGYFSYRVTALQQQYYMAKGYDNPLIQIPVAITSYLRLIFWPDRLSFYQSDFIYTPLFYTLLNITFISFIVFIIFSFFRFKYAFFWLSLLFISLSPSLTPLRISWWVAERYIYLGSAGVIAVAGMLLSRLSNRKSFRYFVYLSVVVFTLALFTRTIVRNNDWKTQDDLWIATGRTAPMDPKTHNNLGDMYARHGDYANAIKEFEIATKLQTNYADGYHNLAVVYAEIKKYDKAIENLNLALKINPKIWQSEMLLANIYLNTKDYQNSLIHVLKATELNPALATFASAGYIYRESGDRSKAKEYFTKALTFDPNNQDIQKAVSELGN